MSILSIQSHVSYGYVGNRAATFPLQSMGYDVWSVNTVNFSNHTGYGDWAGQVLEAKHVQDVIQGISALGVAPQCRAILTGYMGDSSIGQVITQTVKDYIKLTPNLVYLCDPVMGDVGRGFFVRDGILEFFKNEALTLATIITPNHFEAEALWGNKITNKEDAKAACAFFHAQGVKIVLITSLVLQNFPADRLHVLLSSSGGHTIGHTPFLSFETLPNGMGDLFSAVYLGHYLRTQDPIRSLEQTLLCVFSVIERTHMNQQRELAIIGQNFQIQGPHQDISMTSL